MPQSPTPPRPVGPWKRPADLLVPTKVHTIHLRVAADQWEKMEPEGGPGAGGFGPGMIVAPAFLKDGDTDKDGRLTRAEMVALGGAWFDRFDTAKKGSIGIAELRKGLNKAIEMPSFGGPPPGQRPGGPVRMNLQGPEGKRNGVAGAMGIDFQYVHADLVVDGVAVADVALRYKGNGTFLESRGTEKRSLKIDLNRFVDGRTLAGMTQLNLHNNVTDPSSMNETIGYGLYRAAGVPAPRTGFARVLVTVPGKYDRKFLGLYSLVEDVGGPFARDRFGDAAGAVFKPVTPEMFQFLGEDWKAYNQTYDPKTKATDEEKRALIELCRFVTTADDRAFAAGIGRHFDLDLLARYLAVTVWMVELDGILGPGQNLYLHRDSRTGRFVMIPWDLDHGFGQFGMRGTQEEREQLSIHKPWQDEVKFLERLFKVPAFKRLYVGHLAAFQKSLCDPRRIAAQVDALAAVLRPAVKEEGGPRQPRFELAVAGKPLPGFGPFGGGDTRPIKIFAPIRARSVALQVAGKSSGKTLSPFGFPMGPRPGGPPGPRPGGPPGGPPGGAPPEDFGVGMFLGPVFLGAIDSDRDGSVTRADFERTFGAWFDAWDTDRSGALGQNRLNLGINKALNPFPGGPPGGPPPGRP